MNPKIVKIKRKPRHQRSVGLREKRFDTLERTKRLLLAALKVWELKHGIHHPPGHF